MDVLSKIRPAINVRAVLVCADVREEEPLRDIRVLWPRAKDDKTRHKWGEEVEKPTPFPKPKKDSFWEGDNADPEPLLLDQTCQVEDAYRMIDGVSLERWPSKTRGVKDAPVDMFTWWLTKRPKAQPLKLSSDHIECLRRAGIDDWKHFREYGEEDFAEMERVLTQKVQLGEGADERDVSVPLFVIRKLCRAIRKLTDEDEWGGEDTAAEKVQSSDTEKEDTAELEDEQKEVEEAREVVRKASLQRQYGLQGPDSCESVWLETGICAAARDVTETLKDMLEQTLARFSVVRARLRAVVAVSGVVDALDLASRRNTLCCLAPRWPALTRLSPPWPALAHLPYSDSSCLFLTLCLLRATLVVLRPCVDQSASRN